MNRIITNLTGEIKALETKLEEAVKETPELKASITALEKYLASERVAHGDMKTKYVNERNLNIWLEKKVS
jgi:regulator of replication initiation timing